LYAVLGPSGRRVKAPETRRCASKLLSPATRRRFGTTRIPRDSGTTAPPVAEPKGVLESGFRSKRLAAQLRRKRRTRPIAVFLNKDPRPRPAPRAGSRQTRRCWTRPETVLDAIRDCCDFASRGGPVAFVSDVVAAALQSGDVDRIVDALLVPAYARQCAAMALAETRTADPGHVRVLLLGAPPSSCHLRRARAKVRRGRHDPRGAALRRRRVRRAGRRAGRRRFCRRPPLPAASDSAFEDETAIRAGVRRIARAVGDVDEGARGHARAVEEEDGDVAPNTRGSANTRQRRTRCRAMAPKSDPRPHARRRGAA